MCGKDINKSHVIRTSLKMLYNAVFMLKIFTAFTTVKMSFFDKIYDIAHIDLFKYVFHSGSDKVFVANISKIYHSKTV